MSAWSQAAALSYVRNEAVGALGATRFEAIRAAEEAKPKQIQVSVD